MWNHGLHCSLSVISDQCLSSFPKSVSSLKVDLLHLLSVVFFTSLNHFLPLLFFCLWSIASPFMSWHRCHTLSEPFYTIDLESRAMLVSSHCDRIHERIREGNLCWLRVSKVSVLGKLVPLFLGCGWGGWFILVEGCFWAFNSHEEEVNGWSPGTR